MRQITTLWWSSSPSTLKNEQRSLSYLRTDVFGEIQHLVLGVSWCEASCLAHVINLATQALIKGHSKAKYYNPATPDEHIPDVDAYLRDEVGLIRAIAVKVSPFVAEAILHAMADTDLGTIFCETEGVISNNTVRKAQGERAAWWRNYY